MDTNLVSVIIAGITTGGLTCFAVQGGLLTSAIANARKVQDQNTEVTKHNDFVPILAFVLSKALTYSLIGALLGGFGSLFNLSLQLQAIIQIVIGLYMLGVALNLLQVHPFFRYFIVQPPRSLQRLVRKVSKGNHELTTPALLGLLTIFIPCGTTLAMEALAISTGSALEGALIMLTFVISSSWVFWAVGLASTKLSDRLQSYFYKITAAVLLILAILSVNSGLNLFGFPYTIDTVALKQSTQQIPPAQASESLVEYDSQKIKITIDSRGYTPSATVLRKDVPVELTLETKNSYSCANAFAIPSLNIMKLMPENGTAKISFTPKKSGRLPYSCSMGMFRGEFTVI